MAELIVVGFDDPGEADRALTELARLQKEYLIDLEDAVVAIRGPDGKLRLKQSVDLVGVGAASGGLWGAMWGLARRPAVPEPAARACDGGRPGCRCGGAVRETGGLRH